VQIAHDLLDRLATNQVLAAHPRDRLHALHPPPTRPGTPTGGLPTTGGRGRICTPIPLLRGSTFHADPQAGDQSSGARGDGYEQFDLRGLDRRERYRFLSSSILPRPIAFVTTIAAAGGINAAPFSQFLILAVDPGLLAFSVGPGSGREKDTLLNVRERGEFVINAVSEGMAAVVQTCSEAFPPEVSEVEVRGLDLLPSERIAPPRIAASRLQFECRLERIVEVGAAPNALIVGEILLVHARQGLVHDWAIDLAGLAPVGRLGGRRCCRIGDVIAV